MNNSTEIDEIVTLVIYSKTPIEDLVLRISSLTLTSACRVLCGIKQRMVAAALDEHQLTRISIIENAVDVKPATPTAYSLFLEPEAVTKLVSCLLDGNQPVGPLLDQIHQLGYVAALFVRRELVSTAKALKPHSHVPYHRVNFFREELKRVANTAAIVFGSHSGRLYSSPNPPPYFTAKEYMDLRRKEKEAITNPHAVIDSVNKVEDKGGL